MEGKEPEQEMRKKLLHNWTLKLASLVLAAILWFLVVQIEDPKDTKTFNNVPVRLTNTELLEKENKVFEVLDNTDTVSVTVRAPKSTFEKMRASDIVAEADISKLTDINTIGISYSVQNVDTVDSIEGNHEVVRLNVEDKSTKWIKVTYTTVGEVAEGYIVASAAPDQTLIEVSGPKSVIERISYAGVEIDVSGATSNLSANVDISLFDKENAPIEQEKSVTKNVDFVHMTVEVLATKDVPVEVNYMGIPAEGFMATGVVLSEPATVKIAGTSGALSNISKISIPEDRLNITGESSDMTDIVNLREYLPENIRLADGRFNGKVTVTIYIEPIVQKTLEVPAANITVTNVPEGLEAQLPEDTEIYTLQVSGLDALITPLRQTAVRGSVDIAAWMEKQGIKELPPGVHTVPVTFDLAEEITRNEITVRVTVRRITDQTDA